MGDGLLSVKMANVWDLKEWGSDSQRISHRLPGGISEATEEQKRMGRITTKRKKGGGGKMDWREE